MKSNLIFAQFSLFAPYLKDEIYDSMDSWIRNECYLSGISGIYGTTFDTFDPSLPPGSMWERFWKFKF